MAEKRARQKTGDNIGKIQANSFPEVKRGLKKVAPMLEDELKLRGERWDAGPLLELVAADFLTMGIDEQRRRAKRGQAVIEAIRLRSQPGAPMSVADAPEKQEGQVNPQAASSDAETLRPVRTADRRPPEPNGDHKKVVKRPRKPVGR